MEKRLSLLSMPYVHVHHADVFHSHEALGAQGGGAEQQVLRLSLIHIYSGSVPAVQHRVSDLDFSVYHEDIHPGVLALALIFPFHAPVEFRPGEPGLLHDGAIRFRDVYKRQVYDN